jgi:putative transposase
MVSISQATLHLEEAVRRFGMNDLRELRQLRDENSQLKRLVADLSLDRQIQQEIVSKKL